MPGPHHPLKLILLMLSSIAAVSTAAPITEIASDSDGRFTFTCSDPSAKAVTIRGDWAKEPLILTRDSDGRWTGQTGTVPPGAHEYSVTIESADQPSETSRILHVPRADDARYSAAIPHGTVHVLRYESTALGSPREAWLYTPPGYETGNEDYPLLVLQHAGADTQKTWVAKGKFDWLLDELIASGRSRPMVVLMLDGHPKGEPVYFGAETRVAAMNDLQNEIFDDAIPLVEANYRVEKSRRLRGLAGPSVGGGQTLSIGLKNLDRFAWIGVFSPGHAIPEFMEPALADAAGTNAQLNLLWISCARDDEQFAADEKFVADLTARGIRHEWHPTEGAHNWPVWRRDLTDFLCRVFQKPSN